MRREDFGTEVNGVISLEYCYYCYWKGKLLDPDITVDKMIERVAARLVEMNKMAPEKALQVSKTSSQSSRGGSLRRSSHGPADPA